MRNASNNEIKLLRKLARKKYRENEQRFVVEGERAVEQVLENGLVEVETVFVVEGKAASDEWSAFSASIEADVLDEVADTENPQGILAVCKMPDEISANELREQSGIIVAIDAIQDPGNMGTILRTAAWFGAKALIAGKGSVDVYHPKVVRSTAGATGSIPVLSGELEEIFTELEANGWQILLLDGGPESINLRSVQPAKKTIIVVGNEGNGISESLLHSKRKKVRIESAPGQDKVESLNAAIAVSIALWGLQ
ncbi:TrmH family RNA methyltransferase [Gracilimonas sediminicola]|uniref:RNA methyltransferase n=1 Tax=Gracilimonas sediminicola TaxID=2952158 RepID=A0A9X2L1Y0_9BACT|nr:RNA methyltransferase [Gracilimonas sediminicola]MCP9290821.1 RNA methyltransferase [Gracilimonas sediminicola]